MDKPAGVGCRTEASDTALEARLEAHGLGPSSAESAPPARASGVTLLARGARADAAPLPWARLHFVHVAGVAGFEPRAEAALSRHAARAAVSHRILSRRGSRALLQLGGRAAPHEILPLLRRAGLQVVGDEATAAPPATRLLLHTSAVRGPIAAEAPLPGEFESWLAGEAAPEPSRFAELLVRAGAVRFGLWPDVQAFRLIGEDAGEIAGVTVDRYGPYAVLSLSSEAASAHERAMVECLMDHGARAVYVKRRVRADLRRLDRGELWPAAPSCGDPAPEAFEVKVGELAFWVRLGDGASTGLFLDQRANWLEVSSSAAGSAFLNLFSYTGAFTVAAALGGARETTSVDLSRRALSNAHANLELNAVAGPSHRLLRADAVDWLRRAERAGRRFDWVVIDPPSFGTREKKGVLDTERDYPSWLARALALAARGGRVLAVGHHKRFGIEELMEHCARAGREQGRALRLSQRLGAWDCPTLPGAFGAKSVLASLDEP